MVSPGELHWWPATSWIWHHSPLLAVGLLYGSASVLGSHWFCNSYLFRILEQNHNDSYCLVGELQHFKDMVKSYLIFELVFLGKCGPLFFANQLLFLPTNCLFFQKKYFKIFWSQVNSLS